MANTIGYNGSVHNNTQATINADQWYEMEFYFNPTSNGKATLWINGALACELTGDFSGLGNIGRVYPCIGLEGNNTSAITVYHDNYRVDDVRVGR